MAYASSHPVGTTNVSNLSNDVGVESDDLCNLGGVVARHIIISIFKHPIYCSINTPTNAREPISLTFFPIVKCESNLQSQNTLSPIVVTLSPIVTHMRLEQPPYLQPIITQYFIDNKSEIWLLFLIAHSKR